MFAFRRAMVLVTGLVLLSMILGACAVPVTPAATTGGEAATEAPAEEAAGEAASDQTFVIGMSQANKGEPWRQAMNDQIEAAAAAHP